MLYEKDLESELQNIPEKNLIRFYNWKSILTILLPFLELLLIIAVFISILPEEATENPFLWSHYLLLLGILIIGVSLIISSLDLKSAISGPKELRIYALLGSILYTIQFLLPPVVKSIAFLDLTETANFLRILTAIILMLGYIPTVYMIGKNLMKRNISLLEYLPEPYLERKLEEKRKREEEEEKE